MSKNTTLLGIFKFFKFIENYLATQNRAEKLFLQTLSENTTLLATILAWNAVVEHVRISNLSSSKKRDILRIPWHCITT